MDKEAAMTKASETPAAATTGLTTPAKLPLAASLEVADGTDRNGVFRHLVKDDGDIAGLVAYSIYKQNKLDWLAAFESTKKRAPNDAELSSYIIGEGTPRRLATYRHLAEATLAGRGPDVEGSTPNRTPHRLTGGMTPNALSPPLIGIFVLIAILFIAGFWLAAHYTMASR